MWNDMLYSSGHAHKIDAQQWGKWRSSIITDLGGLSSGFRSEMLLRGYRMIEEMTGKVTFIQGWVLAITGKLPSRDEDRLLNAMFINTALADPRFWFNRVARLGATVKSSPAACMAAGILTNEADFFSSGAAFKTASFLQETLRKINAGEFSLDSALEQKIMRGEIIGGFGRVLARGSDERNPSLLAVAQTCGLDKGNHLALARQIETLLQAKKTPHIFMNNGGLKCALLSDMGFSPLQISIFYTLMLIIGMAGNVVEAYERPPGEFLPLSCDDVSYVGPERRILPITPPKYTVLKNTRQGRIVAMDSISYISAENRRDIIICGSHAGAPAATHCLTYSPRAVIFNDAGGGKNNAGTAGLLIMNEAGIPAATIDFATGMLGDGLDSYDNGIISSTNIKATECGVRIGMSARKAASHMAKRALIPAL